MLDLEDLLENNQNYNQNMLSDSQNKVTYLPELQEIKEIGQTNPYLDTFYHHLGEEHHHNGCNLITNHDKTSDLLSSSNDICLSKEFKVTHQKKVNKSRNQTKNIPKNFGKGIITFVEKNAQKLKPFIESYGFDCEEFISYLKTQKSKINSIAELRGLWTGEMGGCVRVLSNLFFRKYALQYIFNSRISSYGSHIKYRSSLWRALQQPESFNHIKQY